MEAASFRMQHFWLAWVGANAAAWIAAMLLFPAVGSISGTLFSIPAGWLIDLNVPGAARPLISLVVGTLQCFASLGIIGVVLGSAVGLAVGIAEWVVFRRSAHGAGAWLLTSPLGWAVESRF